MNSNYISAFILFLVVMTLVFGCSGSSDKATQSPPLSSEGTDERSETFVNEVPQHNSRSSLNPPIDCPLRKQGITPHDLKPFEDTQKYIDFLERSDRAVWQKPDAVIRELHLLGAEKIADVGAGSGYFTFRFARALPEGKVYAIDIAPEMLRHIHHKAMTEGMNNV